MNKAFGAKSARLIFIITNVKRPRICIRRKEYFFPDAAKRAKSILDVGCACGGFATIMHSLNENLKYTGIDIVHSLAAVPDSRKHVLATCDYNGNKIVAAIIKDNLTGC